MHTLASSFVSTDLTMEGADPVVHMKHLDTNISALTIQTNKCIAAIGQARRVVLEESDRLPEMLERQQGGVYRSHGAASPRDHIEKLCVIALKAGADNARVIAELQSKYRKLLDEVERMGAMAHEQRDMANGKVNTDGLHGFHRAAATEDAASEGLDLQIRDGPQLRRRPRTCAIESSCEPATKRSPSSRTTSNKITPTADGETYRHRRRNRKVDCPQFSRAPTLLKHRRTMTAFNMRLLDPKLY